VKSVPCHLVRTRPVFTNLVTILKAINFQNFYHLKILKKYFQTPIISTRFKYLLVPFKKEYENLEFYFRKIYWDFKIFENIKNYPLYSIRQHTFGIVNLYITVTLDLF